MNLNDDENDNKEEGPKPGSLDVKSKVNAGGAAAGAAVAVSTTKKILRRTVTEKLRLLIYSRDTVIELEDETTSASAQSRNYHLILKFTAVATLSIALVATAAYGAPGVWHKLTNSFEGDPITTTEPAPLPGLVFVGDLEAKVTHSNNLFDVKEDHTLPVPVDKLDTEFRQTNGTSFSGGGAQSSFNFGDVPPGLYIQCDGSVGDEKRWAVLRPYDGSAILTENGILKLGLYADSGSNFLDSGTAQVKVLVWYKPRPGYVFLWSIGFIFLCFAFVIFLVSIASRIAFLNGRKSALVPDDQPPGPP